MNNYILIKRVFGLMLGLVVFVSLCGCDKKEDLDVFNSQNANQLPAVAQSQAPNKKIDLPSDEEPTVVLNVSGVGRANPFEPYGDKTLAYKTGSNMSSGIKLPPNSSLAPPPNLNQQDSTLSALMQVKVSGILYDAKKPTAIVNIDNTDYLVHRGDYIFNFYIKDIYKNEVAIASGNNIYRAGIGEIVYGDSSSSVNNMQSGFGSSSGYSSSNSLPSLPKIGSNGV